MKSTLDLKGYLEVWKRFPKGELDAVWAYKSQGSDVKGVESSECFE